jgi:prophage regulatory protein
MDSSILDTARTLRSHCNREGTTVNTNPPTTTQTPGRLLRIAGVESLVCLKKTAIYARMANKDDPFPAPVRLGTNTVAWREADVMAWIAARTKEKPQAGKKGGNK